MLGSSRFHDQPSYKRPRQQETLNLLPRQCCNLAESLHSAGEPHAYSFWKVWPMTDLFIVFNLD